MNLILLGEIYLHPPVPKSHLHREDFKATGATAGAALAALGTAVPRLSRASRPA